MKKLFSLISLMLFFAMSGNAQNVLVNPGAGSYPTLKAAFDAINAGTHTGAITINIILNTIETATATLNGSGTGSANYTSVLISPSGGPRTIEGSLAGMSTGAIIRLLRADNVTIDGTSTLDSFSRDLTIRNNSRLSLSAAIWLSSTSPQNGCSNNIIKNCEIACNAKQDTNVTFFSWGIISTGDILQAVEGEDNDDNQILGNRIIKCRYGIYFRGATNLNDNNVIMNNIVGPESFVGGEAIGKDGIFVQLQNNCNISGNEVKFVGYVGGIISGSSGASDRIGIAIGLDDWESIKPTFLTKGLNYTVNGNRIHDIIEQRGYSSVGILCGTTQSGAPTGNIISNNEIYNILSNGIFGQTIGIGHIGNRADRIVYNSIYMTGDIDPPGTATATQNSAGIIVNPNEQDTALTIKNNSIYVDITSNTVTLLHYCIIVPSAIYGWGSGGCDNNDYYLSTAILGINPQMRLGGLGGASPIPVSFFTLATWQTAFTPSQDANSISADPIYCLGGPNYLIPCSITSPLKYEADPIPGITNDILGEIRDVLLPTIGAYEFDSITLPVKLSSLTASVNNRDVTLYWTTASELNNSGFNIERSIVNGQWSMIAFVQGNGTSSSPNDYSFIDRELATGKYNYRLKQIDFNGNFEYFNLNTEIGIGVPTRYDLSQNYPNPFNPTTKINYDLPEDGKVSIKLFDISGREVATLVNNVQTAGYYTITFNGSNLSSGTYYYRISAESDGQNFVTSKKMILIK